MQSSRHRFCLSCVSVLLVGWATTCFFPSGAVADTSFILEYRPSGFDLDVNIPLDGADFVFEKEPDFGGRRIVRGAIPMGDDPDHHVGFAWDEENKLLYLDLNRNLDLTDDPGSPVSADDGGWGQTFSGITLHLESGGNTIPYHVRIRFWKWSGGASCRLTVLSGWAGEIDLAGHAWSMAFADNLDGTLGSGDEFALERGDAPIRISRRNTFQAARRLGLDNRAYDVAAEVAAEDGSELRMVFTGRSDPMAAATLEGTYVSRLVLRGGAVTVIVDDPQPEIHLPVGTYRRGRVYLDGDDETGIYEARTPRITIESDKMNRIPVGGPLNHAATVRRSGSRLVLDYRLLGVGGEQYERMVRDRRVRPQVTIACRGKEVASGAFEWG